MAIERREQQLGTADDPDIIPLGNEVEVIPDPSREDQIRGRQKYWSSKKAS